MAGRARLIRSLPHPAGRAVIPPSPVVRPPPPPKFARALLVGINYINTPYQLAGCINDVQNVQAQLQKFFPGATQYRMLTDATAMKPTKANIMASLDWLVAGLQPGQNIMFHYSGHGGQVRDANGDEVEGYDECIYPISGGKLEIITDDEIRAALAARVPAGSKCFVVLDACHSGSAVDLRCTWQAPTATALTYTENQKYAKTVGNVIFLSGCMDTQTAADTADSWGRPCGALTMALLATWAKYGKAIKLKYLLWDVRQFLRLRGYTQIPQLSTGAWVDMNGVFDLGV